jgi:hypothetical protein
MEKSRIDSGHLSCQKLIEVFVVKNASPNPTASKMLILLVLAYPCFSKSREPRRELGEAIGDSHSDFVFVRSRFRKSLLHCYSGEPSNLNVAMRARKSDERTDRN